MDYINYKIPNFFRFDIIIIAKAFINKRIIIYKLRLLNAKT